jgi:hypothetical protein
MRYQLLASPEVGHEVDTAAKSHSFVNPSWGVGVSLFCGGWGDRRLHAIHSPFYWRIFKKIKPFSGFKNPHKKFAKQENSSLLMDSILYNEIMRVENQTNQTKTHFYKGAENQ